MENETHIPSAADGPELGNNGTSTRTVPESDLIALKQSLESKVTAESERVQALTTQLAEVQAALDSERTGRKPVEERAQRVDALEKELTNLKSTLESTNTEYKKLLDLTDTQLAERLVKQYRLSQEKVSTLSLEEKQKLLDILPAPSVGYDLGGSGTGSDVSSLSARDKIRYALSQN